MKIIEETIADLVAYESVSIRFLIESRVDLPQLIESKGATIIETPAEPRWKDYDDCEEDRPSALPTRFDTANWGVLAAYEEDQRVGGAIIAIKTPGFDMLQGRDNLAVIVDFRVAPEFRGKGGGKTLFNAAKDWAIDKGCTELHVETQDTNVAASRFYRAMGCSLISADPNGYGKEIDEAKLIWGIELSI